jgi:tripartite-type tricarboxylate transporter receptor subunit TctC
MASEATKLLARVAACAVMLAVLPNSPANAQSPAEFYKGKLVDMQIGYSVGGGYDLYARLVARYLGKHIPGNPTLVPKNMEGAASLRLANWLYAAAPKDGSVIGAMSRGAAFDPLLGNKGAQFFDASKFAWLGSANDEVSVCVALKSSGVTKFDDLVTKELTIGSNGVGDDTYQFPAVMNATLGTKFKIVTGYPGGNDITLALDRGEVHGRCGWSWSSVKATRMDWVDTKMTVIVQMSLSKHPDLPYVPLIMDLAKTDEQRQIFKLIFARQVMGRPYALPPGVPKDRVEALRQAFAETMADKEFLAEAERAKFEITPVPGDKIDALVKEIYQTPPEVVKKATAMVQ